MKNNKNQSKQLKLIVLITLILATIGTVVFIYSQSVTKQFIDPAQKLMNENPDLIKGDGQDELRLLVQNKKELDVINTKLDKILEQTKK
jgi:S-adenosylhomocysteine hydrolase